MWDIYILESYLVSWQLRLQEVTVSSLYTKLS